MDWMMNAREISVQDLDELELQYVLAKKNVGNSKVVNGYPIYGGQVTEFMRSLSGFKWGNSTYNPSEVRSLIGQVESASLMECKSIFTDCSRGERFANGHWVRVLEGDIIDRVIDRVIARMRMLVPQIETQP